MLQIEKLRVNRFDNIFKDIQTISCKGRIQIEFLLNPKPHVLTYYTVRIREQSKMVLFLFFY